MKIKIVLTTFLLSIFFITNAQFGVLSGASKLLNNGLTKKLQREPITTNFSDCDKKKVLEETFGANEKKLPLCNQTFIKDTGYVLTPGFYKASIKSFCLKAGTYGPSKGDGYLYAPIKGAKKEIVYNLLNNWKNHPEIQQQSLQLLLWAIVAKTKFKDLSPELRVVSAKLLSTDEINALSSYGIEFATTELMKKAVNNLPAPVQQVMLIENDMRQKFYAASVNYNEMENLAVLAGAAPVDSDTKRGLWSLHKDGYYVKYLPIGYSNTEVEIYVPNDVKNGVVYFNGANQIATPANTGAQRLAQSNVLVCDSKEVKNK
jgi:hypothetical protein